MFTMFDIHTSSCVTLNDVDAEIKRLLSLNPSQVFDAARYHFSAGGARVRAQLGLDAASGLNLSAQASMACAVAPELLHNASLIHDDLQDGDAMRRDTPAVWSRYGKGTAISAGDLLISAAYMAITNHPHPAPALRAMHDAVAITIAGQSADCCVGQPNPEDCAAIAANKSGPLLALPIRLALLAAEAPGQDIVVSAGRALAVAYQTLDDLADREADLKNGITNICLSLEASGYAPKAAKIIASDRAYSALEAARQDASALQNGAGASLLSLADHLEIHLKDFVDAA
jgi:geranylgeranyl pyrophosphate synthase